MPTVPRENIISVAIKPQNWVSDKQVKSDWVQVGDSTVNGSHKSESQRLFINGRWCDHDTTTIKTEIPVKKLNFGVKHFYYKKIETKYFQCDLHSL